MQHDQQPSEADILEKQAAKFASCLVEENCHDEAFDVQVDTDLIDKVEVHLRRLGCKVEKRQFSTFLTVTCPSSAKI